MADKNRIIFLDVDGVLWVPGAGFGATNNFNLDAMRLISKLCAESNACIVMTSTRADTQGRESLQRELFQNGLQAEYADPWRIEETDVHTKRGKSIKAWLDKKGIPYSQCVIIDDRDISEDLYGGLHKQFVKVDSERGFSPDNYDQAQQLLSKTPQTLVDRVKQLFVQKPPENSR